MRSICFRRDQLYILRPLESIGDGGQIFNFGKCCQWGPVKVVFSFCGNFLPIDIQGLTFGYDETHFLGTVLFQIETALGLVEGKTCPMVFSYLKQLRVS